MQQTSDRRPRDIPNDLTVDEALLDAYRGATPAHVAVIMDGNGRWARQQGKPRLWGHKQGANAVRRTVEACRYLGVDVLTLYAFSSQNWARPEDEVSGLMTLFDVYIKKERKRLIRHGIKIRVIGNRQQLGDRLGAAIASLEADTADNEAMLLQVAVSYGGREELVRAAQQIACEAADGTISPSDVDAAAIESRLYTAGVRDPDLVIRTSGEMRISNFLLWQIAYSELYVTQVLWPAFGEADLIEAFGVYGSRQRRFGKTGEQIEARD